MVLTKILKRKDASSLIVAIIAALAIAQFLGFFLQEPATKISGVDNNFGDYGGPSWQTTYLQPFVLLILQFVALEIMARVVIAVRYLSIPKSKTKRKK